MVKVYFLGIKGRKSVDILSGGVHNLVSLLQMRRGSEGLGPFKMFFKNLTADKCGHWLVFFTPKKLLGIYF
jgi:hypothetical protein